jgi:phosphate starvation-inducible PhoH-like protein
MRTVIDLDSNSTALALAGEHDAHLKILEERLDCGLTLRGNILTLDGADEAVAKARSAVDELLAVIRSGRPVNAPIVESLMDIAVNSLGSPSEVYGDIVWTHRGRQIGPRTVNQKRYVDTIRHNTITFGIGPAGTGKTYLATAMAVSAFFSKQVGRIILTRPAVEAGESLGFLPGTVSEKVDPYFRPLFDALYDMMDGEKLTVLIEKGEIEVAPLAFMRGRTLNDSFIILDEAQNTSPEQMKMFLTRLGFGSKMVVTGDITQIDLPHSRTSGLVTVRRVLDDVPDIGIVQFDGHDVVATSWCSASSMPTGSTTSARRRRTLSGGRSKRTRVKRSDARDGKGGGVNLVDVRNGTRVAVDVDAVARLVGAVLDAEGVSGAELAVEFVGESRIRALNARYRDRDQVTDVLSFPLEEAGEEVAPAAAGDAPPRLLGDVVVCARQALRQARGDDLPAALEVSLLVVHGVLHLLGYDHDVDAGQMALRQGELLETVDWESVLA